MKDEHLFWLQILGDHAYFLYQALNEKEKKEKQQALQFRKQFDYFLQEVRHDTYQETTDFLDQVLKWVLSLKAFKLYLIKQMLNRRIMIDLVPTFINHMINELEEYERILLALKKGKIATPHHTVHSHLLWLLDASGHSSAIASSYDDTEYTLYKEANQFKRSFHRLYLKAVEYKGFLRTKSKIPSLNQLDAEGTSEIVAFSHYMRKVKLLIEQNQALADISPYLLDHMLREECYYLQRIHLLNPSVQDHPCDITQQREMK